MYLVEKHIIDRHHRYWDEVDKVCLLAKNLFNYANYLIRQKFISIGEYINYKTIQKICQPTSDYQALPKKAFFQSRLQGQQTTSTRIQRLSHKRNCKVIDYLHQASRIIVDYLAANRIGTLVIGKNDLWKQSINLGDKTNQNFVCIPHARFIEMLT